MQLSKFTFFLCEVILLQTLSMFQNIYSTAFGRLVLPIKRNIEESIWKYVKMDFILMCLKCNGYQMSVLKNFLK